LKILADLLADLAEFLDRWTVSTRRLVLADQDGILSLSTSIEYKKTHKKLADLLADLRRPGKCGVATAALRAGVSPPATTILQ
jgi:hypothetical protein